VGEYSRSGPLPCPCALLLDYLIRQDEEHRGERDPERPRRLAIEDQLELGGLLHREIGGLRAFQDAIHMFPPGRARLATKPAPAGSPLSAMTMGMVVMAC
jgi:hypothetical protein